MSNGWLKEPLRKAGRVLLNPYLTGVYVLFAICGIGNLAVHGLGYAERFGPASPLLMILGALFVTPIIVATRFQWRWWRKIYSSEEPVVPLPLVQAVVCSLLLLVVGTAAGGFVGDSVRALRTRRICGNCQQLFDELAAYKHDHAVFPPDVRELPAYRDLSRYTRMYLVQETNSAAGVHWNVDDLDNADVGLFVGPEGFECVVPFEKSSYMSFSHFRVYVFEFPGNKWRHSLLHWSLTGAYID